jgi:Concanavalin A-like lectin/glucanases superfamily
MTFKQLTAVAALVLAGASSAHAEFPFATGYSRFVGTGANGGPNHGYIEVADQGALDITGPITIEGWVNFETPFPSQTCRSIVGKGFSSTFWVGVCGSTLRAYLKGNGSSFDSGLIPAGVWTHFAVTFDGAFQRHYINGVQTGSVARTAPLPVNNQPLRIGSDVNWTYSPNGDIEELRIWSVARSPLQIDAAMFVPASGFGQPGLIGAWGLNGNGDVTGGIGPALNGTVNGAVSFVPALPGGPFLSTSRIPDFRFKVRITGGSTIAGVQESDCVPESACISGAVPGRSEVFIRVVGPRPNGYLWPNFIKFTQSRVEVWIEQISTGGLEYYDLAAAAGPTDDSLTGLFDRLGWLP